MDIKEKKKTESLVEYARKNLSLWDDEDPREECAIDCPSCSMGIVVIIGDDFECDCGPSSAESIITSMKYRIHVGTCDVRGTGVKELQAFNDRGHI